MKKYLSSILSIALVGLAFSACTKEAEVVDSPKTFTISFKAEVTDPASRATLTPNDEENAFAAAWEVGDSISLSANGVDFTAEWKGSSFIATVPEKLLNAKANLSAKYPYVKPSSKVSGPGRTQDGSKFNSFYDTMSGTLSDVTLTENASFVVPMKRETSILYFHLTSKQDVAIESATLTYGDNKITTTYAGLSSSNAILWFNVIPGSYPMSLEIKAVGNSTATISTNGTSVSYETGKLYKILKSIELKAPAPIICESVADLVAGDTYVISKDPSFTDKVNIMGMSTGGNNFPGATLSESPCIFTLNGDANSGWYFSYEDDGSTYYLDATSTTSNNYLKRNESLSNYGKFSISFLNGAAVITSMGKDARNVIQYNSNNNIYSCYTSGQSAVYLYRVYDLSVPKYKVTLSTGTTLSCNLGESVTLPILANSGEYIFAGWSINNITAETSEKPELLSGTYEPNSDISLYAVYSRSTGDEVWIKKLASEVKEEGIYAILTNNGKAFTGNISSGHGQVTSAAFSFTNNEATECPEGTLELVFAKAGDGYSIYNKEKGYLSASKAAAGNLVWRENESSYWLFSKSNWTYNYNSAYLRSYNNSSLRTYGANNGDTIMFAKKEGDKTTYYVSR